MISFTVSYALSSLTGLLKGHETKEVKVDEDRILGKHKHNQFMDGTYDLRAVANDPTSGTGTIPPNTDIMLKYTVGVDGTHTRSAASYLAEYNTLKADLTSLSTSPSLSTATKSQINDFLN